MPVTGGRPARLRSGATYLVQRDGRTSIVAEDYSYKTDSYYDILFRELKGEPVDPGTRAVLDASIVPLCLDSAARAGVPVAECTISQSWPVRLPAIIYGLNYFSCTSEFSVVMTSDEEKEAIRHVTNNGKYPFCYQLLDDDDTITAANVIFGSTTNPVPEIRSAAGVLFREFRIPLMTMIFIGRGAGHFLSSLTPTRYSNLSKEEKNILRAYISRQGFL